MPGKADPTWTGTEPWSRPMPTPTLLLVFDGERGPVEAQPKVIGPSGVTIGRAAGEGGIELADPRASRVHATVRLDPEDGAVVLTDRSSNGSFVNGVAVQEAELEDGDVLRLGASFLVMRIEPPDAIEARPLGGLIGRAPAMRLLRRAIHTVAPTDATVLVVGESGTGKELVARAIHQESGRRGPFVAVNCSAIPLTLAESELFGHAAGAFTGAQKVAHPGYFRRAHGGTLFLDEIGEMPAEIQPKLLRVLEERVVTPVGGTAPAPIDVRVVAATNRDLEGALDRGFRGDLYARLSEITLRTPPLRERREDVLPLLLSGLGEGTQKLEPRLVEALLLHPYRFNVRELLKMAKELRIQSAERSRLGLSVIAHRLVLPSGPEGQVLAREAERARGATLRDPPPSRETLEALVRECRGNISELGRRLGRSRRQVYRYLETYAIDLEQYR
jgi:DNA-binding NtrC family response regulator